MTVCSTERDILILRDVLQNTDVINFVVAPCINNIKHFIFQLMYTHFKILRLLKYLKL